MLVSRDTIDESVDSRLREKVTALSVLMRDPELVRVALPEPDTDVMELVATEEDMDALEAALVERA